MMIESTKFSKFGKDLTRATPNAEKSIQILLRGHESLEISTNIVKN